MADLASFSISDRRAAPHSRAHQYRLTAVSAVIQSAARLERGRTLNNVRGREGRREGVREGGRREGGREGGGEVEGRAGQGRAGEGRAGQGRAGQGRAGQGRAGQGGGGEGRGGEGRGGDCPHFPQTRTFVTAEPSRPPAKRVNGYYGITINNLNNLFK